MQNQDSTVQPTSNSMPIGNANVSSRFLFTPGNLLENLEKLGPWSAYGLAVEALQHYFPDAYDEDEYCDTAKEVEMLYKLGCNSWQDAIIKYQKEVGYVAPNGFNPGAVNEF
jgi:hypothetical protein